MSPSLMEGDLQRTVGRNLRAYRAAAQVAEQLEVPQSFVSKYESGERRLDVVELGHVAGAKNLSLRDILDRLDGQKSRGQGHA